MFLFYTHINTIKLRLVCGCGGGGSDGGGKAGVDDDDEVYKINLPVLNVSRFFMVQRYCSQESPRRDQFQESILEFIAFVQCPLSLFCTCFAITSERSVWLPS